MKQICALFAAIVIGVIIPSANIFAQAPGDYRSATSGNWNSTSTWETYNGTSWVAAGSTPTSSNGVISVLSGHTVTVTAGVTIDQTVVDAGGTLDVNSSITLNISNGTGDDLLVSGILSNNGTIGDGGTIALSGGTITNAGTINSSVPVTTTGSSTITQTGTWYATLTVSSGTTTASGVFSNTMAISGTLSVSGSQTMTSNDYNVTVNAGGTISGDGKFIFSAVSYRTFTNNGTVSINTFETQGTYNFHYIAGSGSWTGSSFVVNSSQTEISSAQTWAPSSLEILSSKTFKCSAELTFNGSTLTNNGTISQGGSGALKFSRAGTTTFTQGGTMSAPMSISSGTTVIASGSIVGLTVSGTLSVNGSQTVTSNNYNVTVNAGGTISGDGKFIFSTVTYFPFTNNGTVSINTFETQGASGSQYIAGSGSWTGSSFVVNSSQTEINTAQTWAPSSLEILSSKTLKCSAELTYNGATLTNNGTISNEYGSALKFSRAGTTTFTQGGTMSAPMSISSGTTVIASGSIVGLTVSGTLSVNGSQTVTSNSNSYDVTVNSGGVISGDGTFIFSTTNFKIFTNNGTVSINSFETQGASDYQSISGSGSWTGSSFVVNSSQTRITSAQTWAPSTLQVNASKNLHLWNDLTFNGSTLTNNGTISHDYGAVLKFSSGGTTTLSQNGSWSAPIQISNGTTVDATGTFSHNVTVDAGGTFTTSSPIILSGSSKTITINGSCTASDIRFTGTSMVLTGTGSFSASSVATIWAGASVSLGSDMAMGKVVIDGTFNITSRTLSLSAAGTPIVNTGTFTTTSSTIKYNGSSAQDVVVSGVSYNNLEIDKSGGSTATLAGNLSVSGTLTVTTGTLNTNNNNLTVTGGTSVTGTLAITGGTAGTITFNNLTINTGGVFANYTENDDVTINGSITNNGTLNAGTGIYTLAGSGKTLSGSNAIPIPNTTITGSYTNNGTLTLSTALSGSGSLTGGAGSTTNIGGTSGIAALDASTNACLVNYNGADQTVKPISYYDLTLSGSGTKTLTGVSTINNDFTISGTASATAETAMTINGDFTIGSGATFNASSYNHTLKGNWSNSGTFNAGTGTMKMNGTSAQTMSGSTFNNLEIDNASGVTFLTDETVNGTLTLTNGKITLGANNLTIGPSGSISGANSSRYIVTNSTGQLRKEFTANGSFTFPIADADGTEDYSPVNFTFNSGSYGAGAYVSARVIDALHPNNTSTTHYITRYWTLTQSSITSYNYDATFNFIAGDVSVGGNLASMTGARWNGTNWFDLANAPGSYYFSGSALTALSDFTAGEPSVLPVELTAFTAAYKAGNVQLHWRTATEVNNYGFDVERSLDSRSWSNIGFVSGHGSVNTEQRYAFTDRITPELLSMKNIFYRLKQIDRDGQSEYSSIVSVSPIASSRRIQLAQNFPNPFTDRTSIRVQTAKSDGQVLLKVFDAFGREVLDLSNAVGVDSNINLSGAQLPGPGVYYYKLILGSEIQTRKMILK